MKSKILILLFAATFLTLFATTASAQQTVPSISRATSNLDGKITEAKSEVKTTSGKAEIALARHLKKIGAKFYGAFWCPHCARQKELFGQAALNNLRYIECDPRGVNPRPQLCQQAGVKAYPSWEIKGQLYTGSYSLENLANISGYRGRRDFK